MKCLKKGKEIRRVSEEQVTSMVNAGWDFCSKTEWRVKRDGEKKSTGKSAEQPKSEKSEKKQKSSKAAPKKGSNKGPKKNR
jgi:hypothetical protein